MTDAEKIDVLKASLLNIGRLLPANMEVYFYHEGDDPRARMQICHADGTNTEYAFVSHEPIYQFPAGTDFSTTTKG